MELTSHITRKKAIIAVTKSAYATFHAPPWCPAALIFFLTMMIGRSFSAMIAAPELLLLAAQFLLEVLEVRTHVREQQLARELHGHRRRITAHAGHQRHLHHLEALAFLM